MLIILHEQLHLASITKEWQWVSDKTCIMNVRQTSKNRKMQMILTEHQELILKIIVNQYMHIAWK